MTDLIIHIDFKQAVLNAKKDLWWDETNFQECVKAIMIAANFLRSYQYSSWRRKIIWEYNGEPFMTISQKDAEDFIRRNKLIEFPKGYKL